MKNSAQEFTEISLTLTDADSNLKPQTEYGLRKFKTCYEKQKKKEQHNYFR